MGVFYMITKVWLFLKTKLRSLDDDLSINEIGPTVAGHCAERPCSRLCVQSAVNKKYGYKCAVANCERPDVLEKSVHKEQYGKSW